MQKFEFLRQPFLGELAMSWRERERERERKKEREIMPFIVATYVYASSHGKFWNAEMIDGSTRTQNLETFSWKKVSPSNKILLSKRIVTPAPSYKERHYRNSRLPFSVHESDTNPAPPPTPVDYLLDQIQDDGHDTLSSLDEWGVVSADI